MSPPGWLLVAAAVLAFAAGWCANAEAALTLVAATGVAERPEYKGPLQTVAADLPRYMSVLLLLRAILECFTAVLVTAAFVHWLGDDWRAVLAAAGVVILMHYVLTGVRPQLGRIGPRTERTTARAARVLYPLTQALGPLPAGHRRRGGRRVVVARDQPGPETQGHQIVGQLAHVSPVGHAHIEGPVGGQGANQRALASFRPQVGVHH